MKLGRPPLSDAEHAARGTKPHKSTAKTVSSLPSSVPEMPKHLTPEARREWRRLLPMLLERGSLTEADASVLSLLCETHARWVAAKRDVELNGMMVNVTTLDSSGQPITNRKVNPALKVAEAAERALRGFLVELGLTPRSRDRVCVAKPKNEGKSSFDAYLESIKK